MTLPGGWHPPPAGDIPRAPWARLGWDGVGCSAKVVRCLNPSQIELCAPPSSPSPEKSVRDKSSFNSFQWLHCSSCAAVLGFSSTESITGGCVFRAGRAKAIQLQDFCIFLILRLSWAGWLLYKSEQHQALLSQIHPGAAGLGWGSGALQLLPSCCCGMSSQKSQNPGVQEAKFKAKNNQK